VRKPHGILLVLGIMITLWAPPEGNGASVEHIVMPGKVIQGHAKYEDDCKRCHKPFSKASQSRLCLDCHKKVAADLDKEKGFHGLKKEIKKTECKKCHTEHEGRDADMVLLDKELFDHKLTDFELKAGHLKVKCAGCHNGKLKKPDESLEGADKEPLPKNIVKHRNAPDTCVGCHKETDIHRGRLGENCKDCHEEESWGKFRYDHNKTKFPLTGKHEKVACDACHPSERWKKTPTDCYSCHRLNDNHRGRYGKKCEACHTPEKRGILLPTRPDRKKPLTRWRRYIYNHDKTKFPLKDKHIKVGCDKCHTGIIAEEKLEKTCYGCHKKDDAHKEQQGKQCERCHNQKGWRQEVAFDHDLTKFPLIGLHALTPCEECHLTTAYEDAPVDCLKCHKKDDVHKERLGPKCGPCHNPNGWQLWTFDHKTQTKFELTGSHEGLECHACHIEPVKEKMRQSKECFNCHQKDDTHRGRFGRPCQRCHETRKFREVKSVGDYVPPAPPQDDSPDREEKQ